MFLSQKSFNKLTTIMTTEGNAIKNYFEKCIADGTIVIINSEENIQGLRASYEYAEKNSDNPITHTGALLVLETGEKVYGTNRFLEKVKKTDERRERKNYSNWIGHAEQDVICLVAKEEKKTTLNSTMYMPWVPCFACAYAISKSGVKRLVMHYPFVLKTNVKWITSVIAGIENLLEAEYLLETNTKTKLEIVTYKLGGGLTHLFDGKIWEP